MKRMMIGLAVALAAVAGGAARAEPGTPFGAAPVAGGDLAKITGRADTSMAIRAQNSSNVSHNAVIGQSQTGTISFDQTAFQNLSGLSLLSANTGNNVSINSSLNLNVSVQP